MKATEMNSRGDYDCGYPKNLPPTKKHGEVTSPYYYEYHTRGGDDGAKTTGHIGHSIRGMLPHPRGDMSRRVMKYIRDPGEVRRFRHAFSENPFFGKRFARQTFLNLTLAGTCFHSWSAPQT